MWQRRPHLRALLALHGSGDSGERVLGVYVRVLNTSIVLRGSCFHHLLWSHSLIGRRAFVNLFCGLVGGKAEPLLSRSGSSNNNNAVPARCLIYISTHYLSN